MYSYFFNTSYISLCSDISFVFTLSIFTKECSIDILRFKLLFIIGNVNDFKLCL